MWLDADYPGGKGRHSKRKTLPLVVLEAEQSAAKTNVRNVMKTGELLQIMKVDRAIGG